MDQSEASTTCYLVVLTNQIPALHVTYCTDQSHCRFDRVLLRSSDSKSIDADKFGLIGLEKVEGTQSFPSDHWGIRVNLRLNHD